MDMKYRREFARYQMKNISLKKRRSIQPLTVWRRMGILNRSMAKRHLVNEERITELLLRVKCITGKNAKSGI